MIVKSYRLKTEYTRVRDNKEVSYSRLKTVYDVKCDVCSFISAGVSLDKWRTTPDKKHLCTDCRAKNYTGILRKQHDREKKDSEKIGERRIHKNTKYPEIYVGVDSWHSKVQGHWCREHIYVMEKELGHRIPKGFVVHHIDGDKENNIRTNLVLLTTEEHNNAHAKSEALIFELVKKGLVVFNHSTKLYEFSNKYSFK